MMGKPPKSFIEKITKNNQDYIEEFSDHLYDDIVVATDTLIAFVENYIISNSELYNKLAKEYDVKTDLFGEDQKEEKQKVHKKIQEILVDTIYIPLMMPKQKRNKK